MKSYNNGYVVQPLMPTEWSSKKKPMNRTNEYTVAQLRAAFAHNENDRVHIVIYNQCAYTFIQCEQMQLKR